MINLNQLMVSGVISKTGRSALLCFVGEEPGLEPEPALTLPPLTVELTVWDKVPRHRIATVVLVQVKLQLLWLMRESVDRLY